jgi:hypothetical protein
MVNGLASAGKQLQWRLIYAGTHSNISLRAFTDGPRLFTLRAVSPFRAKNKADAATDAQSVSLH